MSLCLCRNFNLIESLENASVQICCELNKSLTERNYPPLPPPLQNTLKGQICSITQENNPIRALVGKEATSDFLCPLERQIRKQNGVTWKSQKESNKGILILMQNSSKEAFNRNMEIPVGNPVF